MFYKSIFFSALCFFMTGLNAVSTRTTEPNWYDHFIFNDPGFTFELIRTLGYAYEQGADLGESIQTARAVKDGDFQSWYQAFSKTADRINAAAKHSEKHNHSISARALYFRASNYYRSAGFYMVAPHDRQKSIERSRQSRSAFMNAIKSLRYIKAVKIPYENTYLPGYWLKSSKTNAPVVIVNTGFDGTAEELYFETGKSLHERGYHVLLMEGPGQGQVLREQGLAFRPDWEAVITPAVDFVERQEGVDKNKIALMGISMGGYLAPRAAAFEPRIKVLIANGGVYDFGAAALSALPDAVKPLLDSDAKLFDHIIFTQMKDNGTARWFFNNGMWTFNVKTPSGFALKTRAYNLKDIANKIKAKSLIIDGESDYFMRGQAKALFDAIKAPKTYLLFTKKEAAQSHCQMGAIAYSNERILDWLDEAF